VNRSMRLKERFKDCVSVLSMGTDALDRDVINDIFLEIGRHLLTRM
jgi:hypothetical protein